MLELGITEIFFQINISLILIFNLMQNQKNQALKKKNHIWAIYFILSAE